jgi:integrase
VKGHVRRRGAGWAFVVDVEGQRAQRCSLCNARYWVGRAGPGEVCTACTGSLASPQQERRQVWRSGFRTRKLAETELRAFLLRTDAGHDPVPSNISLREWIERWLTSQRVSGLRPHTISRYEQVLDDYIVPTLGGMKLGEVRPRHLRSALDSMKAKGLSARSVGEARNIVSTVFSAALEDELVEVNPASAIRSHGARRRELVTPNTKALADLIKAAEDTVWATPMMLASYLGLRRSEVLGLGWAGVDLDQGTLRVTRGLHRIRSKGTTSRLDFLDVKTASSRRELDLGPGLLGRLKRHKLAQTERRLRLGVAWQDHDLVCERGDGGPLDPDAFSRAFKRIAKKAGLPDGVRLHDVRHGVATAMLAEGVDTKLVSAVLGHASAAFTADQYQHALKGMTKAATSALDEALGN